MKHLISIIFVSLLAFISSAQEDGSVKSVFGTRSVLKIKKEPCHWLKTGVFMGMDILGDTLFISISSNGSTSNADAEAGEDVMIRKKFQDSRMVRVVDFYDKNKSHVEYFTGDINQNSYNGGLALRDSGKMGLMPVFNFSHKKSKLYNVRIDDLKITVLDEWQGNGPGDFTSCPTYSNKFRETVFVTHDQGYDLHFWDNVKNSVRPFTYNTEADEIYPTIYNDSILFFSSDRLKKGVFDLYYYNMNISGEPRLFMPDVIKTNKSELGIAFLNDSTCFIASKKRKNVVTYEKIMFEMKPLPHELQTYVSQQDLLPSDRAGKLLREQGRIALAMFQEKYGVSIPVRYQESIFKDSTAIDPEIVKAVIKILEKENVVDVSFLLPVEITDTAYLTADYSPDIFVMEGLRKVSQLVKKINGSNIMALGFANETGGDDLNLMRSFYQVSSYQMQFSEINGIPESKIHILNSGSYVSNDVSIRRLTERDKRGALYLFRSIKAPRKMAAYRLKPGETKEMVAAKTGMTSFEFTYYNVLLTPFIKVPANVLYIPIKDLVMVWQGHDLRETATKYDVPIKELLKVNSLTDYITTSKHVIYIP